MDLRNEVGWLSGDCYDYFWTRRFMSRNGKVFPDSMLQRFQRDQKGALIYFVFDLLYLNGEDLTGVPLVRRREILKGLLPKEVAFQEWTSDGKMRAPSFLGLRDDREAKEVVTEI
jgi:ATP-dependent DNA ligase